MQHNFQQQQQQQHPNQMFSQQQQQQQQQQQLLQQQQQPGQHPMYAAYQQPQQFLQQQQQHANRPGMQQQQHRAQQMQQQQPIKVDDDVDINDIPSDVDDDAPPGPPAAGGSRPSSAAAAGSQQHAAGHMQQQQQQLPRHQQQAQQHLQPLQQHLALQQQLGQHGLGATGSQGALGAHAAALAQLRGGQLSTSNPSKHMSSVRPGSQQLQQPRTSFPPGTSQALQLMQAQQQQMAAAAAAQQAQQQQKAAAAAAGKRQSSLPAAPEDAQSLYEVLYKAEKAGAGILKTAAGGSAAAAAAAGGASSAAAAAAAAAAAVSASAADGPVTSTEEILRRAELQAGRVGLDAAGRARGDELMTESAIRRLMELQALNRAFRLQPDVVEQLQRLTDAFVGEAVKFGCELASHRRGAVLRPTDLATYLERTHHLHVPGFTKEYHPYRRPAASELHRERTAAVRKAQLAASAGAGGGGGDGPGGGGRGTGAGTGGE